MESLFCCTLRFYSLRQISDVHKPVRLEPELGLEPVRFVEGWARAL
jgi:hypothetical protein